MLAQLDTEIHRDALMNTAIKLAQQLLPIVQQLAGATRKAELYIWMRLRV